MEQVKNMWTGFGEWRKEKVAEKLKGTSIDSAAPVDIDMIRVDVQRKMAEAAEGLRGDKMKMEKPLRTLSYIYLCLKVDEQLERAQKSQGWLHKRIQQRNSILEAALRERETETIELPLPLPRN